MKRLITICAVVGLMLSATGVSWAALVPNVNPPPGAPGWWNEVCEQYAYGWWEADITAGIDISPPADPTHWASNFLKNTDFKASVVGNEVSIYLDNEFRQDLYKEIYIYLTGTTTSTTNGISSALDTDAGVFAGWYGGNVGTGVWSYLVSGEIDPQPSYVCLTVTVPGLTAVTDIWAGENCIPEPATIGLLGLGALGLIRGRRRQGK
jgi:hypothetical protein